jgi:hypothetical protein
MPSTLGIARHPSQREAKAVPAGHQQHHLTTPGVRIMRAMACGVPQRVRLPPRRVERAITDTIPHAVQRWRERTERGRCHRRHQRLGVPWPRPHQTPGRPVFALGRQRRPEPLQRALARIADQRHHQPTEDHKGLRLGTAEVPLAREKDVVDLARDAGATPQVSRAWAVGDVGGIQNTQERFFFQEFFDMVPSQGRFSPVTFE